MPAKALCLEEREEIRAGIERPEEGDLILGTRNSGSAVITVVERTSRRLLLVEDALDTPVYFYRRRCPMARSAS